MSKLRLLLFASTTVGFAAPGCEIDHRALSMGALAQAGEAGAIELPSKSPTRAFGGSAAMAAAGIGGDPFNDHEGGRLGAGGTHGGAGPGLGGSGSGTEAGQAGAAGSAGMWYAPGGRGQGGTLNAAGSSSGGKPNASGGAASPSELCADLNDNRVPDCSETLLKNASFTEVTGTLPNDWTADASAIVAWSALDPRVGIGSGSIVVTTTKAEAVGVSQCVNARAGSTYDAVARSQLDSNTPSGLARVSIIFYSEGSCRGEPRSVYVSPFDGTTSSWRKLELLGARAPDDTSSLRLRLELQKLADVEAASVRFDDVLLKARD